MTGVVSTNALELGIDIGLLDAVIIAGYPGTMMSTRQQAGRAGRKGGESLAILVATANPLDQYFMHHPQHFFSRSHEHAIVDTGNPYIVSGHLLCAAAELPLRETQDKEYFGESFDEFLPQLASSDLLRKTSRGWVYSGRGRAADAVRLDTLWDVSEQLIDCLDAIENENLDSFTPDDLVSFFDNHNCGDILVRWTDSQIAASTVEGKIPKLENWTDALADKSIGLDSLMNLAGLNSFKMDQKAMDDRVRSVLAKGKA